MSVVIQMHFVSNHFYLEHNVVTSYPAQIQSSDGISHLNKAVTKSKSKLIPTNDISHQAKTSIKEEFLKELLCGSLDSRNKIPVNITLIKNAHLMGFHFPEIIVKNCI